ncbi:MAG: zinc ribbon domain-containing protein [Clostridia bacterium]|nr:zinc ribbon domain-containing protein [Clostridia bacterium]
MFCTKCGKEITDGVKFCSHCGAEVNSAKPAAAPAPKPVAPAVPAQMPGHDLAVASLCCSVGSLTVFPIVLGIVGIILGCVAKSQGYKGSLATAGIICGIISIILPIIGIICYFLFMFFLASAL